jgi:protein phosphatase
VITRSLGPEAEVQVDIEGPSVVYPGDIYVLCSDGLTTVVSDAELGQIAAELPPEDACRLLVNLANLRGGPDNITVIVLRTGEVPDNAETAVLPSIPTADHGWGAFVLFCSLASAALVGLGLIFLSQHHVVGYTILGSVLVIAGWWWSRMRSATPSETVFDPGSHSTIIWRPYRTAPAKIELHFLQQLAKLESELHQAAVDERWPVDFTLRDEAVQKAEAALQQKRYREVLAEFARALDLLMVGVQWQRKQLMQRESKHRTPLPDDTPVTPPAKNHVT